MIWPFIFERPPKACILTKNYAEGRAEAYFVEQSAGNHRFALPQRGSVSLIKFFAEHHSVDYPEEFRLQLRNGRLFGGEVFITPDGGSVLRDLSIQFSLPADEHSIMRCGRLRRPERLRGSTFVATTAGSNTFYHWLIEEVPRLLYARNLGVDRVVARKAHAFQIELLKAIGMERSVLAPEPLSHFQCEVLITRSLFGPPGHPAPWLPPVYETILDVLDIHDDASLRRIYISREKAKIRKLQNESVLIELLVSLGFRVLYLEHMSLREQVEAFHSAEIVIGSHGAGLANLIHTSRKPTVIEILNPSYAHFCYWQLAELKGCTYIPFAVDNGAEAHMDASFCTHDVPFCIASFKKLLDGLGIS